MKNNCRRILSLALMLMLVLSLASPVFALDGITPNTGTQTCYRTSTSSTVSKYIYDIRLASGSRDFTIKRSTVTVSPGNTGAVLTGLAKVLDRDDSFSNGTFSSSSTSCRYTVDLRVTGSGTATVKYKIGSGTTTYSTKVVVRGYTNPTSSITLTGVNGGRSFASSTKSQSYASQNLTLSSNPTNAKLVVKAVSGWKLDYISVYDTSAEVYTSRGFNNTSKNVQSSTFSLGSLNSTHNYSINVTYINISTGGSINTSYYIHGANA